MTERTLGRRELLRSAQLVGLGTLAVGPVRAHSQTDGATGQTAESAVATQTPSGGGPYARQTKLAASDGDADDSFGYAAAVSGDGGTVLVGAPDDEDPNGERAGSVYAYRRVEGRWRETATITPRNGEMADLFGSSVAVTGDGTTAVVGAPGDEDPNGSRAGSAYVFDLVDGDWSEVTKLVADDGGAGDAFGHAVAVTGDGSRALVGAPGDVEPNGRNAGSAYAFERDDGDWSQVAKLAAADGDLDDSFGQSVAVTGDGTAALVGAPGDETPNGEFAGSAYAFERDDGAWTQRAKFAAPDGDAEDGFGWSVAVSTDGTTALVGAPYEDDVTGESAGSAYVFGRADGEWSPAATLSPDDGDAADVVGSSVALTGDGGTAIVGAPRDEDPNGGSAGVVYVFGRTGENWNQQRTLVPDDNDDGDHVGSAVAVATDGATAVAGAWHDEDPNGDEAGSAYVFDDVTVTPTPTQSTRVDTATATPDPSPTPTPTPATATETATVAPAEGGADAGLFAGIAGLFAVALAVALVVYRRFSDGGA